MSETRLSLFQIESELLGLIDQREEALERLLAAMTPAKHGEAVQEVSVLDGLIRDYLKREVKKVDGCAFAIKEYEARSAAKYTESAKLADAALRDEETAKRIKQMVLEVMQEFGEKKLPGRLFTISRQGNGGVKTLTIAQPDLVPLTFQIFTVEIGAEVFNDFAAQFDGHFRVVGDVHPDMIREALERDEGVMGAKLEPRGEHIRIK